MFAGLTTEIDAASWIISVCCLHFSVEPPDELLSGLCAPGDLRIEGRCRLCGDHFLERFTLRRPVVATRSHAPEHHVALGYQGCPADDGTMPWNDPGRRSCARDSIVERSEQSFE